VTGLIFFLLFLLMNSFQPIVKHNKAILIIRFRAFVHGEPLVLNKKYRNPFGETFEISRFRFYAGKITPVHADSNLKTKLPPLYHLIDLSDSSSTEIKLIVGAGVYSGIQFQLGVDSADQNRGAQSGVLDPARGMYWTWNSGYLSFKIEGFSPVSKQPAHVIAYHIGGYRYPYNTVWQIRLDTTNDEPFRITGDMQTGIEVAIELDNFFESRNPLHINEISSCTTPGDQAQKISENFSGTFAGLTITPHP
jgi:hypothetical protein